LGVGLLCAAPVGAQSPSPPPASSPEPQAQQRLSFSAPRESRAGQPLSFVVRREKAAGPYRAKLCTSPPAEGWRCGTLSFPPGVARLQPAQWIDAPGRWLFEVRNGEQRIRGSTKVEPRGGRLKVLATGDSMIQIVDGFLSDGLGSRARLRSEAHISTGISKPEMLNWVAKAGSQAKRIRPDVTIVYLGANDGFSMATPSGALASCCGSAWVEEYARRVAQMMRAYARSGAGRVFWLTLPAPRPQMFRRVYGPVNAAIRRAARQIAGVTVVPIDSVFTPGFRYRDTLMHGGRAVRVRQGDGVHFTTAGASIVASKTIARMRATRVLAR
jgi:lysophospholipase L1-like esterase